MITPETTARNIRSARIPDNEGNQPQNERILEEGPDEFHTGFPVTELVARMTEEGYDIAVSQDAGTFVCNDTYYLVGTRESIPVVFIHVPSEKADESVNAVYRFMEMAIRSTWRQTREYESEPFKT